MKVIVLSKDFGKYYEVWRVLKWGKHLPLKIKTTGKFIKRSDELKLDKKKFMCCQISEKLTKLEMEMFFHNG